MTMMTGMNAMIRRSVSRSRNAANCTTRTSHSKSPNVAGLSMVHFFQSCFNIKRTFRPSKHFPLRQIPHQRTEAERPWLAVVACAHAVDEPAKLWRGDGDDVILL